jgi:hypothetical protein
LQPVFVSGVERDRFAFPITFQSFVQSAQFPQNCRYVRSSWTLYAIC